ncbi:small ribosomal subunit protein mS38 [Sorex fumeus]|uniref:small ribosomal subunit protein mS38 n=1 Tax=Sorex fumeus TaxID=62283 RepID=UPI0024ADFB9C|nr:small ribosomal subunit protein mS38 [Sorex fumeus]
MSLLLRLSCRLLRAAPRLGPRLPALPPPVQPGRSLCALPHRAPPAAPPRPGPAGPAGPPAVRAAPPRAPGPGLAPRPTGPAGPPRAPRPPRPPPTPHPTALPLLCRNVLKIRRRKMNHHKYRKLVKRTRFLRRKVREGRLKRKQAKFEGDLRRIWLRAGLKDAPAGWQTPRIYLKGK